jgi:hypothetical protein
MPDGVHPQLLEVFGCQLGQRSGVNLIVAERLFVPLETQLAKPSREIHGRP